MYALYAFFPMLFVIVAMAIFNKPAKIILPIAFLLVVVIAFFVWKIDIKHIAVYSLAGMLKSFEVLVIIFGAILLLNTMKVSGGLFTINNMFSYISPDKRVQALIIGWLFEAFMESVAGFGTPAALAAPLFIILGFPPFLAAFLALIFNTIPVTFGAVGAPVLATISSIGLNIQDAGMDINTFVSAFVHKAVLLHLMIGLSIPLIAMFIMIYFFGKKEDNKLKSLIEILPFTIYAGLAFLIPFFIIAKFSYELPSLIGSSFGLILVIFTTQKFKLFIPKNIWDFKPKEDWQDSWKANSPVKQVDMNERGISLLNALSPYLLIGILLLVTRIPSFGLQGIISKASISFDWLFRFLEVEGVNYSFAYIYNPGIFPFIVVSILIVFFHRMKIVEALDVWKITLKQMKDSTIALVAVFAMIQIMLYSKTNGANLEGMLSEIAQFIASSTSSYFILASPFIGILGTFLAGSATVSNVLFSSLQFETALLANLPTDVIIALQSIGASLGNMVSINKIIAVSITAGMIGIEGKVIRINMIPAVIYSGLVILFSYILYM